MSFFLILLALFIFYLICLAYKYVLKPILELQWYKKQGIQILFFFPLIGLFQKFDEDFKNKNDSLYTLKRIKHSSNPPKIYASNFGSSAYLLLIDPTLIKECLLKYSDILPKDTMITNNYARFLGKNNLVFGEDKEWKKSRKIITTSFNFDFIKRNIQKIILTTEEKLNSLKNEKNIDLVDVLEKITAQSFMRVFFESDLAEKIYEGKTLSHWIVEIITDLDFQTTEFYNILFGESFFKIGLRASDRKLNRNIKNVRNIFVNYIREEKSKKNFSKDNLLSVLLKNEEIFQENAVEDINERITNEMMVLFFAGTDTTSTLLLNALYLMSKKPYVLEKLVNEIDQHIIDDNLMDYELINILNYLSAVLKETLRMCGPGIILFNRIAQKTFKLGDFIIKKDTILNFSNISNFYDEQFFTDPFEFKPDRWLDSSEINLNKIDPYLYIPFSAGSRNCVGQHLALIEAKIFLIKFLKKYSYEVKNKEIRMELKLMYRPREPIIIELKSRN